MSYTKKTVKYLPFIFLLLLNLSCFSSNIPIIFEHKGEAYYLNTSLSQAQSYDNTVVLLGDYSNQGFTPDYHFFITEYEQSAKQFQNVYLHYSLNPYEHELFCFQRWFILKDFMEEKNIQKCFYCDSDVMVYFNADEESDYWKDYNVAFLHHNYIAGGMVSYWTIEGIKAFCERLLNIYTILKAMSLHSFILGEHTRKLHYLSNTNMFKIVQEYLHNKRSFITDMDFFQDIVDDKHIPISEKGKINIVRNDSVFDVTMLEDEFFYEMDNIRNIKKIQFIGKTPYCYHREMNKLIRFKSLHFQCHSKVFMNQFKNGGAP